MFERKFTFYRRVRTQQSPDRVFSAVEQALRQTVGGSVRRIANTFHVDSGTNNLNFAFIGDLDAEVVLTQPEPYTIDMSGTVTLRPNTFFWIMGIGGFFCLWFLWGFSVLYFVMDPRVNYQRALDAVDLEATVRLAQPYGVSEAMVLDDLEAPPIQSFSKPKPPKPPRR